MPYRQRRRGRLALAGGRSTLLGVRCDSAALDRSLRRRRRGRRGAIRICKACGDTRARFRWSGRAQFEGRASLTDEEVAEQRTASKRSRRRSDSLDYEGAAVGRRSVAESPIRGNEYNSFWQDHGRPRQVSSRTSLIVDPPDGRLPFTRRCEEGRSARRRALRSRTVRVVSGSGHRRTLPDRRRHGHDVAGTQRRAQPDRAESRIRHDPSRGISRPPRHPGRRAPTRGSSASGSAMRSAVGKATRWSSTRRTSSTGPTTSGRTSGRGRPSRCTWSNASSESIANTIEYTITVEDPTTFTRPWTAVIPDLEAARTTRRSTSTPVTKGTTRCRTSCAAAAPMRPGRHHRGETAMRTTLVHACSPARA